MLRKALISLVSLTAAVAIALAATAGAGAESTSPIEGVWSFNGGEVAIDAQEGSGTFRGVVVAPTKFSQCFHPVGQAMWTEIRQQADGSYWGLHQWYFETAECLPNPEPGLTAWRVITATDGSKSLKVCFSEPGSKSQPKIAPDGTATDATYGCSVSARISELPEVVQTEAPNYLLLPGNGRCLSRSKFKIRLRNPSSDPIIKADVRLRSGAVRRRAKLIKKANGIVAVLNLRGLTNPKFTVTVHANTALGASIQRKRTYRLCGGTHIHKRHHRKHHI